MSKGAPQRRTPVSELAKARRLLSAAAIRAMSADRWERHRPWLDWPVLGLCVVLLAALFIPPVLREVPLPPVGSIASETVRVERGVVVEDARATALRRAEAEKTVLPVFTFDSELYFRLTDRVRTAVRAMAGRAAAGKADIAARRGAFAEDLGQPVKAAVFPLIEALNEPDDLATAINFLLVTAIDRLVVADGGDLPAAGGIEVRNLGTGMARRLGDLRQVTDLAALREHMRARAGDVPYGAAAVVRTWVLETAMAMARANLVPDPAATKAQREAARESVNPLYARFSAGDVLVRGGERVTEAVRQRVALYNRASSRPAPWGEMVAFGLLLAGLIFLAGVFFRHARQPFHMSRKAAYLTLSILSVSAVLTVLVYHAGRGVADGLSLAPEAVPFLLPVAVVAVLISLLVDSRTSLLAGLGLGIALAYRFDGGLWLLVYYFVGVMAGGAVARHCRRRSDLLKTGLAVGLAQALVVPVIVVLGGQAFGAGLVVTMAFAVVSGGLVALFVTGLLPVFEHLFDEATDMRLLELASADNRLLKELAMRSPGTYYHSVMIGNLAEAAADSIGCNALMCRVMALYHDLGKMKRPSYFAENQHGGNVHDRLPPELSARIIFAHIKDGIDIARKHRLGSAVIDAITQHQGTTLLRVFHAKAMERAGDGGEPVDEAEFRYPGPRPTTREAGILLMADSVEAATRALKEPSPEEVRQRVRSVIADKIADGQLDNCPLTLADIAGVEEAFTRVLTLGVFHSRIEYPPAAAAAISHGATSHDSEQHGHRDHDRGRSLGGRPS